MAFTKADSITCNLFRETPANHSLVAVITMDKAYIHLQLLIFFTFILRKKNTHTNISWKNVFEKIAKMIHEFFPKYFLDIPLNIREIDLKIYILNSIWKIFIKFVLCSFFIYENNFEKNNVIISFLLNKTLLNGVLRFFFIVDYLLFEEMFGLSIYIPLCKTTNDTMHFLN